MVIIECVNCGRIVKVESEVFKSTLLDGGPIECSHCGYGNQSRNIVFKFGGVKKHG